MLSLTKIKGDTKKRSELANWSFDTSYLNSSFRYRTLALIQQAPCPLDYSQTGWTVPLWSSWLYLTHNESLHQVLIHATCDHLLSNEFPSPCGRGGIFYSDLAVHRKEILAFHKYNMYLKIDYIQVGVLSAGSILTGNTLAWIGLNNKILELKKSSDIDITRGYSSSTTSLASRTIDESSISVMLLIMMANRADTSFLTYNKTTIKYAYKTSIYTLTRSTTSQQRVNLNMLYVYFNTNNTITFGTSSYIEDYYFYVA